MLYNNGFQPVKLITDLNSVMKTTFPLLNKFLS